MITNRFQRLRWQTLTGPGTKTYRASVMLYESMEQLYTLRHVGEIWHLETMLFLTGRNGESQIGGVSHFVFETFPEAAKVVWQHLWAAQDTHQRRQRELEQEDVDAFWTLIGDFLLPQCPECEGNSPTPEEARVEGVQYCTLCEGRGYLEDYR